MPQSNIDIKNFHNRANTNFGRDTKAAHAAAMGVNLMVTSPWTGELMTSEQFSVHAAEYKSQSRERVILGGTVEVNRGEVDLAA